MTESALNEKEMVQQDNVQIPSIVKPKIRTRPFQEVYVSPQELKDYLKDLSVTYGCNYQEIYNTIQGVNGLPGESHFDLNAYAPNKYGGSYGVAQYIRNTFEGSCKGDYLNPLHQLKCMCQQFLAGEQSNWDSWCLQNSGNTKCQKRGFK